MRRCEWCNASLEGRRSDARYCNDSCRYRAWRDTRENGREQRLQTVRRPSRNGRGVRVYLTPEDFAASGELRVYDLAVARKLDRAFERLMREAA